MQNPIIKILEMFETVLLELHSLPYPWNKLVSEKLTVVQLFRNPKDHCNVEKKAASGPILRQINLGNAPTQTIASRCNLTLSSCLLNLQMYFSYFLIYIILGTENDLTWTRFKNPRLRSNSGPS
jgi:hypothetical protein